MELIDISVPQQVADNLYLVRGETNALFPHCHTYLFDEDVLIAFDPQCGINALQEALQELGSDISNINYIFNTHFHFDHSGSNNVIKQKSGAEIYIHEIDSVAIAHLEEYVKRYGMTMTDESLESEWKKFLKNFGFKEVQPDHTFQDGDILPGGFEVIHTPGHAPGHSCFYKSESKILISGDIDLKSIWFGNLSSSVADYLNSIEKLKKFDIELMLPSHSEPISNNISQMLELYQQHLINRAEKIYNLIPEGPHTLGELAEIVFKSYPEKKKKRLQTRQTQFMFHFAKITTLNYLNYLESSEKLIKESINGEDSWQRT